MRYAFLSLLMLLVFPSCSKKAYEAQWERPDSAFDPVGLDVHKREARERASQSKFKKGENVTLRNAKTMVFEQNPETNFAVSGSPVSADSALVLEPGPLFLKVQFKNGSRGFVNVSDIVDPVESSSLGLLPVGANVVLPPIPGGDEEMPAFLKAVEEMPNSSLEGGAGVLPSGATSAKPQESAKEAVKESARKAEEAKKDAPSVAPPAPTPAPVAPVSPPPAPVQEKVEAQAPAVNPAASPAPIVPTAPAPVKKEETKAQDALPPSSAEASAKQTS